MIDNRQYVIGKFTPFDSEKITVAGTSIGLTAAKLSSLPKPKKIFITVETAQCRYQFDGTDPDSTTGHLLSPTQSLVLEGYNQMNNIKFIRIGATSAVLQVSYLR